ncbi:MAG: DUF1501 domain-containing protein, partial [Planctomycetaceae bacterium]|nr:DUF1501 domain-containing protein [Planctomycetaceae bacterium]
MPITRRQLLSRSATASLLSGLLPSAIGAETNPLAPRLPHFEPQAKRVILLFMPGGVSQVDSFDPKPELQRMDGKARGGDRVYSASLWGNHRCGSHGTLVSDLFPQIGSCMDDIALI